MSEDQREIAKNVFLRLTTLGEGVSDTRRRAYKNELYPEKADPSVVDAVLNKLSSQTNRLIVANDDGTFEVTHEALIQRWETLRTWLNDDREHKRLHDRLRDALPVVLRWLIGGCITVLGVAYLIIVPKVISSKVFAPKVKFDLVRQRISVPYHFSSLAATPGDIAVSVSKHGKNFGAKLEVRGFELARTTESDPDLALVPETLSSFWLHGTLYVFLCSSFPLRFKAIGSSHREILKRRG